MHLILYCTDFLGFLEPCFQGCVGGSWTIISEYTPGVYCDSFCASFRFMCWRLLIVFFLPIINETKQNIFKLINYWTKWLHVLQIYLLHNSRLLQNVHSNGTLTISFFWNIIPQIKTSSRHCFVPVPRQDLEFKYHMPWVFFLCLVCGYCWNYSPSFFKLSFHIYKYPFTYILYLLSTNFN